MKTSASKGRGTCHNTPASVHAICFMPFEVDLFMATTQSLNFICQRWQWLIHSPESMKSSASKSRNRCHTPASVHAICFMPFEANLFMESTKSLNIICERWQWVIHSQESMKSSASKGRNICHTPASVHGKYQSLNLSILYGNKIFTIPISSFASNCKNRQQIQAIQIDISNNKNR